MSNVDYTLEETVNARGNLMVLSGLVHTYSKDLPRISNPSHLSHPSHAYQTLQQSTISLTRELVEEFFYDDGGPYSLPTPHTLDESLCKSIIRMDNNDFYYCTLHPKVRNIYLETTEHHIKYKAVMHVL
jgi:hypothetical protein